MMSDLSGFNSPNLNPLDYQVWGNAGVLTKAATEAKTSSEFYKKLSYRRETALQPV